MPEKPDGGKRVHPIRLLKEGASGFPGFARGQRGVYAELQCKSNFSFLRGASHPEELAEWAAARGYAALAITDRETLAGMVRMHCAAKAHNIKLIIGAEITPVDAPPVLLYATDRAAYGCLSRIITQGRLREKKGDCAIRLEDIAQWSEGLIAAVIGREGIEGSRDRGIKGNSKTSKRQNAKNKSDETAKRRSDGGQTKRSALSVDDCCSAAENPVRRERLSIEEPRSRGANQLPNYHITKLPNCLHAYRDIFGDRTYLAVSVHGGADDEAYLARMLALSQATRVPLVATNDVHYHRAERRFLQDVLTCIRLGFTIEDAGTSLFPNAERYLKSTDQMQRLFADYPEAIARTLEVADRCTFSLDELRYEYPEALVPPDRAHDEFLAELTWRGAHERYPDGIPGKIRKLIEHELQLIKTLAYEPYFLTVWDIVKFARSRDIFCQGRGSAANSVVCYCLGITSVDPDRIETLFERFVSAERNEPPDIDVDFEHERREEIFQYIYNKYGRDHAGIVAEVISYRPRSAVRDVGKALGLSLDRVDALAKRHEWWDAETLKPEVLRETGLDPQDRSVRLLAKLVPQILGFPRHLSQHVGGFVITRGPLCELVPLENGAMPDRTFIEWDKDDIDALGILKIDCLALGMLTAIHKAMRLLQAARDEGTKGRRDEEKKRDEKIGGRTDKNCRQSDYPQASEYRIGHDLGEIDYGQTNIPRFDCVAQKHSVGKDSIFRDGVDAQRRKVRFNSADAASVCFDRVQYSGRQRSINEKRLYAFSRNGTRVSCGVGDADHHCAGVKNVESNERIGQPSGRDGPAGSGPYPKPPSAESVARAEIISSSLCPYIPSSLVDVPPEDRAVYEMICRADTIGVFQIESRAQMSMLPRLKPQSYYDLVIEVAIVRPGPIQGGMVHPYLRRRNGEEEVTYPNEAIKGVLERTLGVPLFQEQAMQLAIVAAGFTPGEADQLRRAMAAWRRNGAIERFRTKLIDGMQARGLSQDFAERCFQQICGFGEYGFPESHAASFALLVYVSAWLKRYHPAAFCAAILNSQPMGFYQPAQLVRDAIEHGVTVLPVDVNASGYDCRLERIEGSRDQGIKRNVKTSKHQNVETKSDEATKRRSDEGKGSDGATKRRSDEGAGNGADQIAKMPNYQIANSIDNRQSTIDNQVNSDDSASWGRFGPAVRLGMRLVKGISEGQVKAIEEAQQQGPFRSVADLAWRSGAAKATLARLAAADAFRSMGLDRRQAVWQVLALSDEPELFAGLEPDDPPPVLPSLSKREVVLADYDTQGLSLNAHPMSLVREDLTPLKVRLCRDLRDSKQGQWMRIAGVVLVRQRPGTAKGIIFATIEDETGAANLIIRPDIYEKYRRAASGAPAIIAEGRIERQGLVVHLQVTRICDLAGGLAELRNLSRDFQ